MVRRLMNAAGLAASRAFRALAWLSLAQRFALVCLVILVAGGSIIGSWVSGEIESGVINRTSAVTALYVDSFVSPHLEGLESDSGLADSDMASLSQLLGATALGEEIVSFKVWSRDGEVLFATAPEQIGRRFSPSEGLKTALAGSVESHLSNLEDEENRLERSQWSRLVETYSPVMSKSGSVTGAVEFYQLPDDLLAEVRRSQRRGWAIVSASTVAMYILLVGLVTGASRTITGQNRRLHDSVEQQKALQSQVRALNSRLRRAAAAKAQTDEQMLQRLAQDLHDGPAQDLALALLRFETIERPDAPTDERESLATIQFAVSHALDEVRGITTDLRLPELEGLSWADTVKKAASDHRRRTGATLHVRTSDVATSPTPPQRIAAYRVVREALSNAFLHSSTREHWVSLSASSDVCVLSVEDRGRGFDVARTTTGKLSRARLGLRDMRERVELLGGSLSIVSSPGKGTTVRATIPLAAGEEHDK